MSHSCKDVFGVLQNMKCIKFLSCLGTIPFVEMIIATDFASCNMVNFFIVSNYKSVCFLFFLMLFL
jgi:hypothetical protein